MKYGVDVLIVRNQLIDFQVEEFDKLYDEIVNVQVEITKQLENCDMPVQTAIDMMVMADYNGRVERLDVRIEALIDLLQLAFGKEYDVHSLIESTIERCMKDINYIEKGEQRYSFSQGDLCRQYQKKQDLLLAKLRKLLMKLEVLLEMA